MKEVLRITKLSQTFSGTTVLAGVNLSLDRGERLAVIGSSGSGKTTLLRLIAGLEPPTEGEINIDGKPASRPGEVLIGPSTARSRLFSRGLPYSPTCGPWIRSPSPHVGAAGRSRQRTFSIASDWDIAHPHDSTSFQAGNASGSHSPERWLRSLS